jgi:hypothetical protein
MEVEQLTADNMEEEDVSLTIATENQDFHYFISIATK